ncbi:hypothetical protein [Niabella aquatica]
MRKLFVCLVISGMISGWSSAQSPRIVNIINFIRDIEPRDPDNITKDVLYQTVVNQIRLMKKHRLGGTFLLQYDALIDERYQQLLKSLPAGSFEIGGWWEIPQPLVEKAGMKWRGRYPWDWHADVGFSTGYTPAEREKLIDVYMADFKNIFGYYPKSVASWFIDEHSLNYMYEKYQIVASANCKDQYGTDGYTLWGGYWNQAYYPSKRNAYMPAQNKEQQIPVPVFRMLGSDPIHQYDDGLEQARQGVITLEPVYPKAGGDSAWVRWFFKQLIEGPSMVFNYTQAGQENSFTWSAMSKGLEMQFPLIEKLRNEKKIRVETLAESGEWFKKQFPVTPPTSFTALEDVHNGDKKTVWFNSRYYRVNLLWERGTLRFRDIHLFDESLPSSYEKVPVTSNECVFYTLPVMDGYLWSKQGSYAGGWFKVILNGREELLKGGIPAVDDKEKGKLKIAWPLENITGTLYFEFTERDLSVYLKTSSNKKWFIDMQKGKNIALPFIDVQQKMVHGNFENHPYSIKALTGDFVKEKEVIFRITPEHQRIKLLLTNGK